MRASIYSIFSLIKSKKIIKTRIIIIFPVIIMKKISIVMITVQTMDRRIILLIYSKNKNSLIPRIL